MRRVNQAELRRRQAELERVAIANGLRPAKAKTFHSKAVNVAVVAKRWANVPIASITSKALNEWAETLLVQNGSRKGKTQTKGYLSNIDCAFADVWKLARAAGAVPDVKRPAILHQKIGVAGGVRKSFFSKQDIDEFAHHVDTHWKTATFEERLTMLYPAIVICTGIRPADRPNIVYCDWKPRRSRKRRPQPELTCGRIVTYLPVKNKRLIPRGVSDDAQRAERIRQYLSQPYESAV
jgi:hypothetical protein